MNLDKLQKLYLNYENGDKWINLTKINGQLNRLYNSIQAKVKCEAPYSDHFLNFIGRRGTSMGDYFWSCLVANLSRGDLCLLTVLYEFDHSWLRSRIEDQGTTDFDNLIGFESDYLVKNISQTSFGADDQTLRLNRNGYLGF